MSRGHTGAPTVGYLTKRFPRLSETFILDEILGLEAAGVPLRLFAVADPGEGLHQPDVDRVGSPVVYLRGRGRRPISIPRGIATTLAAHLRLATAAPDRWRTALAAARAERAVTGTIRPFLDAGRLAVRLQRVGATHIHAAFAHGPASTARLAHLMTGIPYSFAAHAKDLYLTDPAEMAVKARQAAFVLTCSAAARDELARRSGSDANIVLAYHGVDTERFAPRPRARPDGEPLTLLAVGRLVEKKGYPVLLAALRRLVDRGHDVRLRIVGGGPQRDEVAQQVRDLDLATQVSFAGALTHQEIVTEYGQADLFVQASVVVADGDRDGIPNSLLEAMASGLPVVASDVSGIPEAIEHEVSGLLVPPGDPDALAGALEQAIVDADLRYRLGRAARDRVVTFFDRRACAVDLLPLFLPGADAPRAASLR